MLTSVISLGGSMFYKLIQRAFPNWFAYNSIHIMQPMFTKQKNLEIAEEFGTRWMYSLKDPQRPPKPKVLYTVSAITQVLKNQDAFKVPWLKSLNELMPDKNKDYSDFMLGADMPTNTEQRHLVSKALYDRKEFTQILSDAIEEHGSRFLNEETFKFHAGAQINQIDILRE